MNRPSFSVGNDWQIHEVSKVRQYQRKTRKYTYVGREVDELWINVNTGEQKGVNRRISEYRRYLNDNNKYSKVRGMASRDEV